MTEEQARALMQLAEALDACEELGLTITLQNNDAMYLLHDDEELIEITAGSILGCDIRDLNLEQYV